METFTIYTPCTTCKKFLAPAHAVTCTTCKASTEPKPVTVLVPRPKAILPPKKTYAKGPCGGLGHPPHCRCGFNAKNAEKKRLKKEERAPIRVNIEKELAAHVVIAPKPETNNNQDSYETSLQGDEGREPFDVTQARRLRMISDLTTFPVKIGRQIIGRYYLSKYLGKDLDKKMERWQKVLDKWEENFQLTSTPAIERVHAHMITRDPTTPAYWTSMVRCWVVMFTWRPDSDVIYHHNHPSILPTTILWAQAETKNLFTNNDSMLAEITAAWRLSQTLTDVLSTIQ